MSIRGAFRMVRGLGAISEALSELTKGLAGIKDELAGIRAILQQSTQVPSETVSFVSYVSNPEGPEGASVGIYDDFAAWKEEREIINAEELKQGRELSQIEVELLLKRRRES